MRAAVYTQYGGPEVVSIGEVEKPVPKENEVLVKIFATSVNSGDVRIRALNVPRGFGFIVRLAMGITAPRNPILGMELAGEVEVIGKDVTKFKVGDRVFAAPEFRCHAEYRAIKQDDAIAHIPDGLSFEQAAAISFGGATALHYLRDNGKVKAGDEVLIVGASGAAGLASIQIAKIHGAKVTAVCSKPNHELVKSLGAENVIDYKQEDFTKNGKKYDLIVDCIGTAAWGMSKASLADKGHLLVMAGDLWGVFQGLFVSRKNGKKVTTGVASANAEMLQTLAGLVSDKKFNPIIDKTLTLDEIVEAHRYVDSGRKKGSVIITIGQNEASDNH